MTWADRLLRLAGGDPQREVAEHLVVLYQRSAEQEHRLAAGASQAPTASAETDLKALAAARHALSAGLEEALQARHAVVPPAPPAAANGLAQNHWARLVGAMEAAQNARAQLVRETPRLLELDASLAGVLDGLDRGLHAEGVALRTLIARADPQALN